MKRIISVLVIGIAFQLAFGQTDSTEVSEGPTEIVTDSLLAKAEKPEKKTRDLPADPPRRFSLVFSRYLMLTGSSPDSVPINATGSGTYSIGGGLKFFLYRDVVGLRFTPTIAWTHITYESTNLKTFPVSLVDSSSTVDQERHILTHGEVSLSVFGNITRDEDGDPLVFVEGGGYVGYLISANFRQRFTDVNGLRHKEKIRDLETIEDEINNTREFPPLKYGVFGRLGYKWASLTFQYRLSDIFDEFTDEVLLPEGVTGFRNPKIPPIELGLTIFF